MSIENLSKELTKALKSQARKPKPYDTKGVVKRVENGVAYVHYNGSTIDETPVQLTIDAHVGDEVIVRSSGGRAFIVGNGTAPPTDDTKARAVERKLEEYEKSVDGELTKIYKGVDGINTIIRESTDGVLVAKAGASVGALVNSSGSFDIVSLTWDGNTPTIGAVLSTFSGTGTQIGKNNQWHVNVLGYALQFNPPTGSNAETIKILTGDNDYGQLLFSYTDSGYLYETYLCNGELYILRYNQSSQVDEYISLTADGLLLNDGGTNSTYITPIRASIGGLPSGLLVEDVEVIDGLTVNANNYATTSKSVSKTGYTPLGIVGVHLENATTGGTYNTYVFTHSFYLSGTTAYFVLRNTHASTNAKIKITISVLYVKS